MNLFEERIQEQVAKRRPDLEIEEGIHTIGEFIGAVFTIDSPKDAEKFYQGYLRYLSQFPESQGREETVARSNIGWCFGEGMAPDKIKMWASMGASHPVFGGDVPTPREAFRAGKKMGNRINRR